MITPADSFFKPVEESESTKSMPESLELENIHMWTDENAPSKQRFGLSRLNNVWIFFSIYMFLFLGLVASFLYYLFWSESLKGKVVSVFSSINNIMTGIPLNNLLVTQGECPPQYETIKLGEWPGTVQGCLYSNSDNLQAGNCDSSEDDSISIPPTNPIEIYLWNTLHFCALRYSNSEYYVDDYISCKSGFKKCQEHICISQNLQCPITNIEWVHTYVQGSIRIDKNNFLLIQRNNSEEPIITFHISVDGNPCLDLESYAADGEGYPLMDTPSSCSYGQDNFTIVISNDSLLNVLQQTSSFADIESLPFYIDYLSLRQAFLLGIPRYQLESNPICYESTTYEEMANISNYLSDIEMTSGVFYIISIFGIAVILMHSLNTRSNVSKSLESLDYSWNRKEGKILGGMSFILFLFESYTFYELYGKISIAWDFKNLTVGLLQRKCFLNENIAFALSDYVSMIPTEVDPIFWESLITNILSLIPLFIILIDRHKGWKDDQVKLLRNSSYKQEYYYSLNISMVSC